jgi:hypothetical protein
MLPELFKRCVFNRSPRQCCFGSESYDGWKRPAASVASAIAELHDTTLEPSDAEPGLCVSVSLERHRNGAPPIVVSWSGGQFLIVEQFLTEEVFRRDLASV